MNRYAIYTVCECYLGQKTQIGAKIFAFMQQNILHLSIHLAFLFYIVDSV